MKIYLILLSILTTPDNNQLASWDPVARFTTMEQCEKHLLTHGVNSEVGYGKTSLVKITFCNKGYSVPRERIEHYMKDRAR